MMVQEAQQAAMVGRIGVIVQDNRVILYYLSGVSLNTTKNWWGLLFYKESSKKSLQL
ncbi:hypothetical protein [Scytonema sp. PRP1]|uniref:hypothetical protein n=1 Tax=Scytonema sp. PRP1 TaxID=3120513 RepID=UPI00300BFB81